MKQKIRHLKSTKNFIFGLVLMLSASVAYTQTIYSPDGYAKSSGTTGGGSASRITVSTASAFKSAVNNNNAKVIVVNGRINLGGDVTIGSNTTIVGANTSAGLYNGTIKIQGSNYIIQNLTMGPRADGDVLEVSGATKVFITKCTFHDSGDELCSVVRQADFVTISWCRFYFDNPTDHSYAHLIGNGDNVTADRGKLHVTLHDNWYDNGVKGRQPRVRFGYVHIYNCYFGSNNTDYCIGTGYECHIRVENSHFDNVSKPWSDFGATSSGGQIGWSNLKFEGTSQPTFISNSYPVFSLPYSYSLTSINNVESVVKSGAGNVAGSVDSYSSIINRISGKAADVINLSTSDNANIQQYDYWGGDNQKFKLEDAGSGYYYIKAAHSGKCMRALNGNVIQYTCNTGWWSEMFERIDAGSGYYIIKNRATSTCLRVENSSTANGASIVLDECNTGWWSEQFIFNSLKSAQESSIEPAEISTDLYSIYPTVSSDIVYINLPVEYTNQARLFIYSNTGAMISNTALTKGYVDVSKFNSGLYLIVIQDYNETYSHKFIKK